MNSGFLLLNPGRSVTSVMELQKPSLFKIPRELTIYSHLLLHERRENYIRFVSGVCSEWHGLQNSTFVVSEKWPFLSIVQNGNLYDRLVSWEDEGGFPLLRCPASLLIT